MTTGTSEIGLLVSIYREGDPVMTPPDGQHAVVVQCSGGTRFAIEADGEIVGDAGWRGAR